MKTRETIQADRLLRYAAVLFTVAVLVHNSDHVRRGRDSISADVFWIGSAAILLEVGIVVLVFMRHRWAPLAAVAVGFSLAAGYAFVHLTPSRSWLSDSFPSGDVTVVSWAAALSETAAAVVLGVAGWRALQQRGGLASAGAGAGASSERSLADVLTEPVVLAMTLGNAAIFVISLFQ